MSCYYLLFQGFLPNVQEMSRCLFSSIIVVCRDYDSSDPFPYKKKNSTCKSLGKIWQSVHSTNMWLMCPFVWFGSRDASVSNFSQCRKWWFNLVAQIMIICYWLKSNDFLWGRRGRKNWSSQWPTMLTNITNW